jgi:TDG/mug DNA glycosylase family protein
MNVVLPDVLQANLKVVFCGTAFGPRSAQVKAYYAGRGNYFWDVLFRVGLTPHKLNPHEYQQVLDYGIGLTNIAPHRVGLDNTLRKSDFDVAGLRAKVEQYQPRVLVFNGKRGAQELYGRVVAYGPQAETIGVTTIYVLPSTSVAARGFWDERWWWALSSLVYEYFP